MAHRNSHREKRDKEKTASSRRLLKVVHAMTLLGSMAGYYPLFLLAATYGLEQDGSLPGVILLLGCMAIGLLSFWFSRWLTEKKPLLHRPAVQNLLRYGLGAFLAAGALAAALLTGRNTALGICLLPGVFLYWILGARLREKPYSLMYRQQDLIIQAVLHLLVLLLLILCDLPCRAEALVISLLTVAFCYGAGANQGNLDFLMERRGHDLSHLPPKIRRYNLKLLAVLYAVVVVLLLLRDVLAYALKQLFIGVIWLIAFIGQLIAGLFAGHETVVPEGGGGGFSDPPAASGGGESLLSQILSVLIGLAVLGVLIWLCPKAFRILRGKVRTLWRAILRFFRRRSRPGATQAENQGEYTDTETDLLRSTETASMAPPAPRRALRQFKADVRAFDRLPDGPIKEREGYRLLIKGMQLKRIPVAPGDTPRETAAQAVRLLHTQDPDWQANADTYSRVRYEGLQTPDTLPVTRLLHQLLQMKPLPEKRRGRLTD